MSYPQRYEEIVYPPLEEILSAQDCTDPSLAVKLNEIELRAFYDPAGLHSNETSEDFFNRVAETRAPAVIAGLGRLAGHEIILAEGIHSLLADERGIELPITLERQQAIDKAIGTHAGAVAMSVIEVADELIEDREQKIVKFPSIRWPTLPGRLATSGKVLAAVAHDGVFRRSGKNYYSHPDEVSSIISTAWYKWHPHSDPEEDAELAILRFLAYTHDAPEDSVDKYGKYVGDTVVITPLVGKKILELLDVEYADEAAKALYYLMRTRDVEDNRMEYLDYTERGLSQPGKTGLFFNLTKVADNHNNSNIDPEKIEIGDAKAHYKLRKKATYEDAAVQLLKAIDERHDATYAMIAHSVFQISVTEIRAAAEDKFFFDVSAKAKKVRMRVGEKVRAIEAINARAE